jgi:hypothetical protein
VSFFLQQRVQSCPTTRWAPNDDCERVVRSGREKAVGRIVEFTSCVDAERPAACCESGAIGVDAASGRRGEPARR